MLPDKKVKAITIYVHTVQIYKICGVLSLTLYMQKIHCVLSPVVESFLFQTYIFSVHANVNGTFIARTDRCPYK